MSPKSPGAFRNLRFTKSKAKTPSPLFVFKATNGNNMFASEGYKTKPSVMKTIESIKKNEAEAAVDDQSAA